MEVDEGSDQTSDILPQWTAAHARLKNELTADGKYHNLMAWLISFRSEGETTFILMYLFFLLYCSSLRMWGGGEEGGGGESSRVGQLLRVTLYYQWQGVLLIILL